MPDREEDSGFHLPFAHTSPCGLGTTWKSRLEIAEDREMTELSEQTAVDTLARELRRDLGQQGFSIGLPAIERKFTSSDGTIRYLIAFADGQTVETVWMHDGDGGEAGDGVGTGDGDGAGGGCARVGILICSG